MSNAKEAASMLEIMELVELLRENGDKVLSASSKLSLSTTLLYNLNEAFALIVDEPEDLDSSFQVCTSSKIDLFRDLKFLHDFVQKTVGLKLISCPGEARLPVDITKFRHLKYLELKKVCVELVRGLQGVRAQLESVICAGRRGVTTVHQLLATCGGDAGIGFVWDSLKHLALPHNTLEKLDASLELAPWLQILDLSHNLLTSADELSALPNLKYVNLGYNKLIAAPTFNKTASHSLQLLVLKNNYIENINGLQGLDSLTELDLSYNCITDHSVLWPLEKMSALSWMSLEGNPFSYHPRHRPLSLKYLHPSLSDSKFVLDHLPLSRSEKHLIAENRAFTIRSDQSSSKEYLSSLTNSMHSAGISVNMAATEETARRQTAELTESLESSGSRSRKKLNVREAVITEDEQEKRELSDESGLLSSSYLETSKDHLETKKRILELRKRFGEDNWLSNQAGSFVQDIMGLPAPQSMLVSILNADTTSEIRNACEEVETRMVDDVRVKTGEGNATGRIETEQCDVEEIDKEEGELRVVNAEGSNESAKATIATEPPYDPEEETGDLYLVQKKKNTDELEELFLIISSDDIKERDTITGKVKYSWSTNSVLSCVLGRSDPVTVDIIFDTTREDRQNRRYFAEPDDAKRIVATIGEGIKKRPIQLKVYKCMKCSTHFSQDTEYVSAIAVSVSSARQLKCPTCQSTLVIQTDELTSFDAEADSADPSAEVHSVKERSPEPRMTLQHSDSYSSIGGTEGRAMSVTTSLVHSDSHAQAQVCSSATSLEESRESTPAANASSKKYESDIEVLSNPSQSSIEVLDEATKNQHTPQRKRSSEERRTAATSLLAIPDTAPVMTGLTESSSSGSLTDSICTAYENRTAKQSSAEEKSQCGSGDRDGKFAPVTNLTSMLGGLLQSIKIGSNKPLLLKPEERSQFPSSSIQYSYTDFSSVDHRVKLHIILNVFEQEKEELVLLLRADILLPSVKDTFPGCLVLSTSKVYVLRIDGPEGEDPQRWLHKEVSWTMDRLRSFAPLPFKQGVVIELHQPNKPTESHLLLLCILQDFQRTSNFLFYITDLQLPPNCEVEFSVPEHCTKLMHELLKTSKSYQEEDSVRLLALVSSAMLRDQDTTVELKLSGLIVTGSALVILEDNMQWLMPGSNEAPKIAREQAMSNLIAIEHTETCLTLNFLDEVAAVEGSWILNFVSTSAAEAVINSVQPPWEELFSIPLQITTGKLQGATGDEGS